MNTLLLTLANMGVNLDDVADVVNNCIPQLIFFGWTKSAPTSAKIRCGGTFGNCRHFRPQCSKNTSSKQYLIHHAGSRKSSPCLFATAHGIAVS